MPQLVPGYIENKEVLKTKNPKAKAPKGHKLAWKYGKHTQKEVYAPAIEYACKKMGIIFAGEITGKFKDIKESEEVLSGYLAEFSAQDPVGDVISWFSTSSAPKVFEELVAREDLQQSLKEIEKNPNSSAEHMKTLNQIIIDDASQIPLIHNQWVYAVPKDAPYELVDLPQAISSPAPWQLVKMKD